MNLQQFFLIFKARYKLVLLIFVLTVAVTAVVSLVMSKQYTASAALVVDVKSPDPVSGLMLQGLMAPGYMPTQIDIINSDRVAKAVVKLLHLDQSAVIRQQWLADTNGQGQLNDWLAALLARKLDVKPARDSNVVTRSGSGPRYMRRSSCRRCVAS